MQFTHFECQEGKRGNQLITPTLEEVLKVRDSGAYTCMPVCREIFSDFITPITALRKLKSVSRHVYLLESAFHKEKWGRYTFLGYDPKLQISCRAGHMQVGDLAFDTRDPGEYINRILAQYRSPKVPGLPPFSGGLVGYFSYDYMQYAEPSLRLDAEDTEDFNDVDLMLFDKVICFDNFRQKIYLIANVRLDEAKTEYNRAVRTIDEMERLLKSGACAKDEPGKLLSDIRPLFSKEAYCRMVGRAKTYIHEGDIFQIVLSNRLEADFSGSLLDTYRVLRTLNPSPYMFYFSGTDVETAGASPETLVKLEDGVLHTFPLAGTRPRGKTPAEDERLEEELLADPKELAEHNMLVDLGRNDIGRVSQFGSVKVERYHEIQRYSHVMHIGSTVRGLIRPEYGPLDVINAVLPAGTLSGAPKLRACQLINDLENNKRGIYGGAIGYIDFSGNADMCIAIRLAYRKNGKVFIRSGAGIVADSIPENEWNECMNKARAVVTALKEAGDASAD